MWNGGLANDLAQQEIGDKLQWANGRTVLREAGRGAAPAPLAALRKWLGRMLIAGGQRLQGAATESRTIFTAAS